MSRIINFLFLLLKPNLIESFALNYSIKSLSRKISGNCLDVGCGTMPYKKYFDHCKSYLGLELEGTNNLKKTSSINFFYNGINFPFEPNSFDSIVFFEVIEHVQDDDIFIKEVKRVLKPNGKIIVSVPFCWMEHEKPNDYRRFTKIGLEKYLEKKGFEIEYSRKTTGALYTTLVNFVIILRSKLRNILSYSADILLLPLTLVLHIIGFIEWFFEPDDDSYTSSIVLAKIKNNT